MLSTRNSLQQYLTGTTNVKELGEYFWTWKTNVGKPLNQSLERGIFVHVKRVVVILGDTTTDLSCIDLELIPN